MSLTDDTSLDEALGTDGGEPSPKSSTHTEPTETDYPGIENDF